MMRTEIVSNLHDQLLEDMAFCFDTKKENLLATFGRGSLSSHDNSYQPYKFPTFSEVLSGARMHQDSTFKCEEQKFPINGVNAVLALTGPSTLFAEFNENLYPQGGMA